jgi:hypothetical protein
MSPPFQEPAPPLTAAHVDAWVRNATRKRLALHIHAPEPSSGVRAQAFWEMSELCQEAIEAVRVVSAQLTDESQAAHDWSMEIRAASARLLAQYTPLQESQLLQIFKGEQRHGEMLK